MKKIFFFALFALQTSFSFSQKKSYADSFKHFRNNYIKSHGVVKGSDKSLLQFYPADKHYRLIARFEKIENSPWFMMETSGPIKKSHRVYGKIHFTIHDTAVTLCIYQSSDLLKTKEYKNYLFIPFMDGTTGYETYESGRYLDLRLSDIKKETIAVDFNKAYNPYCAYESEGYNCPVPPKENRIMVAIMAGEKKYLIPKH